MPAYEQYKRQVELMMRVMPHAAEEKCFALKGGTAINFFFRNMPRLSVDIDLVYLPLSGRTEALQDIDAALRRIESAVQTALPDAHIGPKLLRGEKTIDGLYIKTDTEVKIEVTPVMRGCVYEPEQRDVTDRVQEEFNFASMQVLPFADVYAGKLTAAHDRQHPRDLFDVRYLLENEGIDDKLRSAFIVYLISGRRPLHEILAPDMKDISGDFETAFMGMTKEPVTLETLLEARERMIAEISGKMPKAHKEFLLSFVKGEPDWTLLGAPGAEKLPAVRWKMLNLDRLSPERRQEEVERLEAVL